MPVAGGLVTMSRAQSANQEDHLADNVVKCVCTYCTHSNIRTKSKQRGKQKQQQQQPERPSGQQCCQMCLRTSKRHIVHLSTYRNRCSKHRQRGNQDHVVDVVQRNNVCKHKLVYKSTWTMDPMEKMFSVVLFQSGQSDVLHCRAIQTL